MINRINLKKLLVLIILISGLVFGTSVGAFDAIKTEEDALSKEAGTIYLIGEMHSDQGDIDQKKLLETLAKQRKIVLALEGVAEDSDLLFGLEDALINLFGGSFETLMELFEYFIYKKIVNTAGPGKTVYLNDLIL